MSRWRVRIERVDELDDEQDETAPAESVIGDRCGSYQPHASSFPVSGVRARVHEAIGHKLFRRNSSRSAACGFEGRTRRELSRVPAHAGVIWRF